MANFVHPWKKIAHSTVEGTSQAAWRKWQSFWKEGRESREEGGPGRRPKVELQDTPYTPQRHGLRANQLLWWPSASTLLLLGSDDRRRGAKPTLQGPEWRLSFGPGHRQRATHFSENPGTTLGSRRLL